MGRSTNLEIPDREKGGIERKGNFINYFIIPWDLWFAQEILALSGRCLCDQTCSNFRFTFLTILRVNGSVCSSFVYMYIEIIFFILELTQSRGACKFRLQQKIRVHLWHSVAVKTNRKLTNLLALIKVKKIINFICLINIVARTRNNF